MKFSKQILSVVLVGSSICVAAQSLIDKKATGETVALYSNLAVLRTQGFLFAHQDDDAYGVMWKGEKNRSDVKDVCGSYPAVHGWDLGKILSNPDNIDGVPFKDMLSWIEQTYQRGGINTVSWHWDNPVTK